MSILYIDLLANKNANCYKRHPITYYGVPFCNALIYFDSISLRYLPV